MESLCKLCKGVVALTLALLVLEPQFTAPIWGGSNVSMTAYADTLTTSDGLSYTVDANHYVTITGYSGTNTDVTIPSTIDGYTVTTIGNNAFNGCSNLTTVTFTEDSALNTIEYGAFCGCTSLESVTIPDTVTTIGSGAFASCESLVSVVIPMGVTTIEDSTFTDCTSIGSITIPSTVTAIGDHAFWQCNSLTSIDIPDGVTTIGKFAFGGTSITTLTIPDTVTTINSISLYYIDSLSEITIGSVTYTKIVNDGRWTVSKVREDATEVTILTTIGSTPVYSIQLDALSNCKDLQTIYYPSPSTVCDIVIIGCDATQVAYTIAPDGTSVSIDSIVNATDSFNTLSTINGLPVTNSTEEEGNTLMGDLNGDGDILANDLLTLKKHTLGISLLDTDSQAFNSADLNHDGEVLANDLLILKKYVLQIINTLD